MSNSPIRGREMMSQSISCIDENVFGGWMLASLEEHQASATQILALRGGQDGKDGGFAVQR